MISFSSYLSHPNFSTMHRFVYSFLLCLSLAASYSQNQWMRYPAISPDGQWIAFSNQGDIFVVSSQGGEAKQITQHPAHDYMPVWSPDSKNIAFASSRHGNFDVFIVNRNGGVPKRLTFHSSNDAPYTFTPDGKHILFLSTRLDDAKSVQFPYGGLGELYQVPVDGGREKQYFTVHAENPSFSPSGNKIIFHNKKGYEDPWRKHHTSPIARDLVLYDVPTKKFKTISTQSLEHRNPIFISEDQFVFLSEKSGSFNIWQGSLSGDVHQKQLTYFKTHPIRFLSVAKNGTLCFGYHGKIYTMKMDGEPTLLDIKIKKDQVKNDLELLKVSSASGDFSLSPNGKEIAFVYQGDVFVTSVEYATTKQITKTPEQERNVQFSPDGKALVYASERNNSWNIYETKLTNEKAETFYNAFHFEEKPLVANAEETFQPQYSPDGKEVAYLSQRTTIKVINLASKESRTVMPGNLSYSYTDGDQYFTWSPDSRYILAQFFEFDRWTTDIGLFDVSAEGKYINLTQSGYGNGNAKFAMDGQMVYYSTDKYGYRSHGSWGSMRDVEAIFLTVDAYNKFTMTEEEYAEYKENEKSKKKDDKSTKSDSSEKSSKKSKDKKSDDSDKKEEKKEVKPITIEEKGLMDRRVRLTVHSSFLGDFILNNEATDLYYQAPFEKGYDLWQTELKKKRETKIVKKNSGGSKLVWDKDEKNLFYAAMGKLEKLEISSSKTTSIEIDAEMYWNAPAVRAHMFEHAWRQVREKFYVEDLHGVDWVMYKKEYHPLLDDINNGYDFAELLSELLGELNASHTGARYRPKPNLDDDQTAAFGCYLDESFTGNGLKILEIMDKSPLLASGKVKAGTIIEKINGEEIRANENFYPLLNRLADKRTLITFYNPSTGERWEEVLKPIPWSEELNMAYDRWIKRCEATVDKLSSGRVGYVHVRGMDSGSFREVFDRALGKLNKKEALIVDTRFNGGGWLHDDLATFLSGKTYMTFEPRGQRNMGGEPIWKWQKPSCVLMSEGNYSDAHLFPAAYQSLGIGKLIGMPVPGTGTAVWWETMIDGATTFGIPQVGMRSVKFNHLVENQTLEPDIKVNLDYNDFVNGRDAQLERAVEEMMK
jgi:Tol biopolymer transport system component/C-terminal processing protease CtpA/Prc